MINSKNPATEISRRTFLAAATALPAASLFDSRGTAGAREDPPWYSTMRRCGQINYNEADPLNIDPGAWMDYWDSLKVNAVLVNGGGIVAYYPTQVPYHHRSKFLGSRDVLGEMVAAAKKQGGIEAASKQVEQLIALFGRKNVYVELQRHFHREEESRNRAAIDLARSLNLPLLATNGVNYATPKARELCDAFTAIRHHRTLVDCRTPALAQCRASPAISARDAATLRRSARSDHQHSRTFVPSRIHPQRSRLRISALSRAGRRDHEFFSARACLGRIQRPLRPRCARDAERARRQIEKELALIEKLKLAGYFLIVWDLVRFCREQNILVQGRGSAANSAVCYSLGITAVDAVGMELLFERFLSEERGEWPDIDLDLPSGDEREKVIQYVYQRYGERGAAMTANVITYRNRMAAREMGKALGFDPETLDQDFRRGRYLGISR